MIVFLTIGQTPREDLLIPYQSLLNNLTYKMIGALDGINKKDIPQSQGEYPLITKLNNGSFIKVEKTFLEKELQRVVDNLHKEEVELIVLLCAGDFNLNSKITIFQPNKIVPLFIQSFTSLKELGVVIPVEDQADAATRKWNQYGFKSHSIAISMNSKELDDYQWERWINIGNFNTIIFDCTGYMPDIIQQAKKMTNKKVFGTDELLMKVMEAYLY